MKKLQRRLMRTETIKQLVIDFAPKVYDDAHRAFPKLAEAEAAFIAVFVRACREYRTSIRPHKLSEWFSGLQIRAFVDLEERMSQMVQDATKETSKSSTPRPGTTAKEENPVVQPASGDPDGEALPRRESLNLEAAETSAEETEPELPLLLTEHIPPAVLSKLMKYIQATLAEKDAEETHRGPVWTNLAVAILVIVALLSIGYGLYRPVRLPAASAQASLVGKVLPNPFSHLPVTPVGQFALSASQPVSLTNACVLGNVLWLPSLYTGGDSWPYIKLARYRLSDSGQPLQKVEHKSAQIELMPPADASVPKSATSPFGWDVQKWTVEPAGSWLVAVVTWAQPSAEKKTVTQIYLYNAAAGTSALVESYRAVPGALDTYLVAAGSNHLVVQSGFSNAIPLGGSPFFSLPLDVYTLKGINPARALTDHRTLASPSGLMVSPAVDKVGVIYQGIVGVVDAPDAMNTTWYRMDWEGQVTRYIGPPKDNRPHWAVTGVSGTSYWVETTPDGDTGKLDVLMAELTSRTTGNHTPASTLSGPVSEFAALGNYLIWVQTSDAVRQLVVAQVQ